jgi:NSS family neurotransmitter:Na+ symporter
MAELTLGRHTGRNALDAFLAVRPRTPWAVAGALALLASFLVLSYYAVIAGWVLAYVFKALAGSLRGLDVPALRDVYTAFVGHPWQPVTWQAAFLALTAAVVVGGVRGGIERRSRILMPGLVVLLAMLAVRVFLLDGAWEGLVWLFRPHWEEISARALLRAMGQVFFSFGLGIGVMITYGSYRPRTEDIHRSTVYVAAADAGVALLAAGVVIPALFAFSLPVEGGAGLLFATLPAVLGRTLFGDTLTVAFFVMVTIAALTSAISMLEALVAFIDQRLGISRVPGAVGVTVAVFAAGVPSALAPDVFAFVDTAASDVLLPVAGLLTALFVGWVWGVAPALAELRRGAGWFPERLWVVSVCLLIPTTIAAILLAGLLGVR